MKKEYERGNIREVINNIPDMNLAKRRILKKMPSGYRAACIF